MKTSIDYKKLPDSPGVYIMKDAVGHILYVGKAGNLRRRVSSYFERPHDVRIETLVSKIARIDHEKTDTALEALILEAELIRKFRPPFNVKEKDDKSFLYVGITREKFPRVLLVRAVSGNVHRRDHA
jgi:excinuclease ABC subunit C